VAILIFINRRAETMFNLSVFFSFLVLLGILSCHSIQIPTKEKSNSGEISMSLSSEQIQDIVHLGASTLLELEKHGIQKKTGYKEDVFVLKAASRGYELDYFSLSHYCRILKLYQLEFTEDKLFLNALKYAILFDDGESGGIVEYYFPELYQRYKLFGSQLRVR